MGNDLDILERISNSSFEFEHSMDNLHRKQTGSYYTDLELTITMMSDLVNSMDDSEKANLYDKTFLEPCVGTGNFVFAYLKICKEFNFTKEQYKTLVNNIYVCDINKEALEVYKDNLKYFVKSLYGFSIDEKYFDSHIGTGLLFDVDSDDVKYISIDDVFGSLKPNAKFDIVVTNPPYKNLKSERGHYSSEELYLSDKHLYSEISKMAGKYLKYSTMGTLNLYKMFVEEIVEHYSTADGYCSLLIPASILTDKTCEKLRLFLFDNCKLASIRIIPEDSKYVDASQALCAIQLCKNKKNDFTFVSGSLCDSISNSLSVKFSDLVDAELNNSILILSENEYSIREQMLKHPRLKTLNYISNLRGELDLTLHKEKVVTEKTKYQLLRGKNIGFFHTVEFDEKEYVAEEFVINSAKKDYVFKPRLVCQQIANMAKKRRIAFTLIPENFVLGNSCNFISVAPNEDGIDEYFLLGILNSNLIDWYFKLSSSNNHINNYEIDSFPIPTNCKNKREISDAVKEYINNPSEINLIEINRLVSIAYGIDAEKSNEDSGNIHSENCRDVVEEFSWSINQILSPFSIEEARNVISDVEKISDIALRKKPELTKFEAKILDCIETKYRKKYKGEILNHTTFKLSDLDLEMIKSVPQGGSWKDIPFETVKKSKRLSRITETGGRTTLYGRIDYSKPSYTITTYFNRPGNGTYVHPTHERVLSVREAARFQTFPDDYVFYGNKNDMLKQVGNAVPVLMAYCIGKKISDRLGCNRSVDLFSGAGGMTYGFKLAGISAVISNDLIENACVTLKANSPEINVLCGDITKNNIKEAIIDAGISAKADIICGGPPCQGFSMAGYRKENDPRNELFRHFVDIVKGVNPKVIVFENVEGILSYQSGKTYREIIELFSELGYNCEGRKLLASNYGVPQRRKRVIILCVRKDVGVYPYELFPDEETPDEDSQISAYETIYDLEGVECSENAKYNSDYSSRIIDYFKGNISVAQYFDLIRDN